ncbi:tripartite motif-containing protein 51-like [Eptesicus fuscus]|uniref:tripartite motif-containing protein 51-like n=1 Tax=Eptesicus fuscus TaxID=29078 RepID=UPI002403C22B|nr:tripartite motif-containing protein 51-like [Eptesicus fuscus]
MERILQVFQNKLTCSICRNYFVDPITIDCGHSFCRPCFDLNWQNTSVLAYCSECQKAIQQKVFKTNVTLKQLVLIVRKTSLWQFLHSVENECRIHMKAKQIFCEDQRSLLCLHCSTSQGHEAHRHCYVEEAVEEHREKLLNTMCSLWQKCCENDRKLNVETVTTRTWATYVISKGRAVRAVYENLPPVFYLERQYYIEKLIREGKEIFEQLKCNKARMEHKRELLRGMHTELKEMCHKPDVELLLHFGDILHRSEAACMHMPQPLKPELTVGTITRLIETFNFFKVIITLQHGSTPGHVFLQGDLINLSVGCGPQGAPCTSPLSECFLFRDAQTFTSGRHYWEIEVGDTWNWALGVSCDDWIEEKIHLQKAFYLLGCAKTDMHHSVFTTCPLLLQYVPKPIGRVGVFLDYEGRSVTFVNVAKSSLICRIAFCSFSPRLRPIFCCSHF